MPPNYNQPQSNATVDSHGHLDFMFKIYTPTGQKTITMRNGYVAAVQASYVAIVQGDNLLVIDPLSSGATQVLWSRSGISEDTEVFGDDQFIYLVDGGQGRRDLERASACGRPTALSWPFPTLPPYISNGCI